MRRRAQSIQNKRLISNLMNDKDVTHVQDLKTYYLDIKKQNKDLISGMFGKREQMKKKVEM